MAGINVRGILAMAEVEEIEMWHLRKDRVFRDRDNALEFSEARFISLFRSVGAWVQSWGGNIPQHAVIGGQDYCDVIYVARASHMGDTMIGKLLPTHLCCYIPWNRAEVSKQEYEVLCNPNIAQLTWEVCGDGSVPLGALQGGRLSSGEPVYIGRHNHQGTLAVGSIVPSCHCLFIPFGGKEILYFDYEVLTCRTLAF